MTPNHRVSRCLEKLEDHSVYKTDAATNRRAATLLGLGLALAIAACLLVRTAAADEPAPPNIVFLLTDDQRWDTLGCMGNPIIQTPNIDRLAEQGVVFTHCFVTTSICMTNRACIFTGQYAARHGVWSFRTNFTPEQLRWTYPGRLKEAGYYLGFIGKWGVGQPPKELFDYNQGWPGQNRYFHQQDGRTLHLTSIMSDQAMEFFDGLPADRPFCLSISFKAPHCQYGHPEQFLYDPKLESLYQDATIPPPPLSEPEFFEALPEFLRQSENRVRWQVRFSTPEKYQKMVKAYYRLISGVDRVVGRIRDKLREKGLEDNTVIIFSGDNGFYLGERGFAGKWLAHEVSLRVPLVVFDPRLPDEKRGRRRDEMVLSIDIAPTILALAEQPIPEQMQGESLLPLVQGYNTAWRTEFFYEHLFAHARIPANEAVRDQRFKYIRYVKSDPLFEELYDLKTDPHEARNLAPLPEYRAKLKEMRRRWRIWHKRAATSDSPSELPPTCAQ